MSQLRLSGPEIGELRDLLKAAFQRARFEDLLLHRLDKPADGMTSPNDNYPTALGKVVVEANASLWWRDLVRESRNALPTDPNLAAFAERYEMAPRVVVASPAGAMKVTGRQLELRIQEAQSTYNVLTWRKRLGEIEGRVCRIEFPAKTAWGTGVLIGPNAVLTNYHVIERIAKGEQSPNELVMRFDYKVLDDGVAVSPGVTYPAANDWLYEKSPYSPHDLEAIPTAEPTAAELDFAVLRVEGTPGNDPVGGPTSDPHVTLRGWETPTAGEYDFLQQRSIYIVQHPDGMPMQVALDSKAVIGLSANRNRVRYTTTTEPGSSGSPCFGPDWQWVALHHSGDPKYYQLGLKPEYNAGVPMAAIQKLLQSRGKADAFGNSI
jgi:V8-like Glu-specific endopeptidase